MKRIAWTLAATILAASSIVCGQDAGKRMKDLTYEVVATTITVTGLAGTKAALTMLDLSRLPQQTVSASDHGTAVTFEGVLLSDILRKEATPSGEKFHSTGASYYVLAGAADDYKAVFAWAEVDSEFTDKKIYVVTKRDGKPLAEKDGPFEVVAPGDKRNGRWVRQLRSFGYQTGELIGGLPASMTV